ncbi:MAG: DUF4340 domain-containing protein [Lachnospiraceae bacterium]|nr:DUF4340 domain-containing protein [Lachnospiraceae bacterium]
MKKSNIILIVLLSLMAVGLCVLYFVMKDRKDKPGKEKTNYFTITTLDTEKINRIALKNDGFDGEFVKSGDEWIREDAGVFPVNQANVTNIISIIAANLRAFSKVENPAALSEYGLSEPPITLKLYSDETLLIELYVGRKHPSKEWYYMKIAGDDNVYIVSDNYHRYLSMSREEFLENIRLPYIEDKTLLREIQISGDNVTPLHAIYEVNNPYDYSSTKSFRWYFTEPFKTHVNADLSTDTWEGAIDRYRTVSYESLVAFRPSDFGRYGLENPAATVYVRYTNAAGTTDQSYTLYIGNQNADGLYYARIKGIDWVFLMRSDVVKGMLETDVASWYYKTIFFPGLNVFEKMTVKAAGRTFEFVGKTGSEGETVYVVNGRDLPDEEREEWARLFLQLKYKGMTDEEATGKEVLSFEVVVKDNDTHTGMTVTFYEKNDSVYLVAIDGIVEFTADVRDVNDFIAFMESMK